MNAGQRARDAIAANPVWYHSIELTAGIVTPGVVDLRRIAERLLPDDLTGRRALDVGTFDGFWAFEMEKRGAEVVAIDIGAIEAAEWPPRSRPSLEQHARESGIELGRGFSLASECLGSAVRRVVCPVYELEPEAIGGPVDLAFSGAILLHLRDPVRALERIHGALHPGGELRVYEPVSLWLSATSPRRPSASFQATTTEFNWWLPNLAGLAAYMRAASFKRVRRSAIFRPPSTGSMRQFYAAMTASAGSPPG
jgi:SAM-dependent methyltransferase